ncbi:MAG: FtsW/RodA/SpoVE family cell cycle protein [Chloroflexota bacterium]
MTDTIQGRLLRWAALFLFIYSIILTLSPAVRERSWDVDYRFSHWVGFVVWLVLIVVSHRATANLLPDRDPYLFPVAALLSGWGVLTIWRLDETFGFRQLIWMVLTVSAFVAALRLPQNLFFLRRYKYILLATGLFLTALTLIFGTNPSGLGPRLWLGFWGVYFQPSEPLKLLLVIYLAAYLADHHPIRLQVFPLLFPTMLVTGLALLLLLVQRDLGTASIFILLYTVILFLATGQRRVLLGTAAALSLALIIGYVFVGVIRVRVDGWLNPWADPAGQSYQIIQSLLAVANGGTGGRGPGIGNPGLVPVAISDFIFAAIAEETGLVGTVGLLALIWFALSRGMIASLRAPDRFRRFLAAGITTYLGIQSLLIIGGNLRLLPLTGVTLPFVSYGGSSLLTSYIALLLLLMISAQTEIEPAPLPNPKPYTILAGLLAIGVAAAALTSAWWALARRGDLLTRTDNPRRTIADRYVQRGSLFDRNNDLITVTQGTVGSYERIYVYPDLAPVIGYTHPIYGQAGLEASLDNYLRGLQGNPSSLIWWNHLLYGTPPGGLDVRLSIDLDLQATADKLLADHPGAIILMNAQTGEILAMASHPTFDPAQLDQNGDALTQNPEAPLLNRGAQGLYPIGTTLLPFTRAEFGDANPEDSQVLQFYDSLGLFDAPSLNMPTATGEQPSSPGDVRVSPLQVTLVAATFSMHGILPAPRIAMAVNTPEQGWVVLPAEGSSFEVIPAEAADEAAQFYISQNEPFWQHIGRASTEDAVVTWALAGTVPDWRGTPLVVVVALEEDHPRLAASISSRFFTTALDH